nr:MAG TPA: hypothetical protein [Caudoviricetes sp.]
MKFFQESCHALNAGDHYLWILNIQLRERGTAWESYPAVLSARNVHLRSMIYPCLVIQGKISKFY